MINIREELTEFERIGRIACEGKLVCFPKKIKAKWANSFYDLYICQIEVTSPSHTFNSPLIKKGVIITVLFDIDYSNLHLAEIGNYVSLKGYLLNIDKFSKDFLKKDTYPFIEAEHIHFKDSDYQQIDMDIYDYDSLSYIMYHKDPISVLNDSLNDPLQYELVFREPIKEAILLQQVLGFHFGKLKGFNVLIANVDLNFERYRFEPLYIKAVKLFHNTVIYDESKEIPPEVLSLREVLGRKLLCAPYFALSQKKLFFVDYKPSDNLDKIFDSFLKGYISYGNSKSRRIPYQTSLFLTAKSIKPIPKNILKKFDLIIRFAAFDKLIANDPIPNLIKHIKKKDFNERGISQETLSNYLILARLRNPQFKQEVSDYTKRVFDKLKDLMRESDYYNVDLFKLRLIAYGYAKLRMDGVVTFDDVDRAFNLLKMSLASLGLLKK